MTDKEKVEENPSWEVVSLTASTYAAAPGPQGVQLHDGNADTNSNIQGEDLHTSMFMSGHFVFPPNQHENLPLDPPEHHSSVIHEEDKDKHVVSTSNPEEMSKFIKAEEDCDLNFFDGKLTRLAIHGTDFAEDINVEVFNMDDKEKNVCGATEFCSLPCETITAGSTAFDEKILSTGMDEQPEQGIHLKSIPQSPKLDENDHFGQFHVPFEAWLKKGAGCIGAHAKDVNSVWSICIAVAVMGVVILGYQWQRERTRIFQLK